MRSRFGLRATVEPTLGRERLLRLLDGGALVMASVHRAIRWPELPAPGRGGHLVLVTGYDDTGFHLRNPSGHHEQARAAVLSWARFEPFFAGRGMALLPRS